jgi:hypothetical protein
VPLMGPGRQARLGDDGVLSGRRFGPRLLQAGAVADDGALDGFGQVVPQMPPVSDLDGQRRALRRALGVAICWRDTKRERATQSRLMTRESRQPPPVKP